MEQFSLAMWLVERKLKGIDPPTALTLEMTPPSNRAVPSTTVQVKIFNYYFIIINYSLCIITLNLSCFSIKEHFKSNPYKNS